jgi:hypothetical protein
LTLMVWLVGLYALSVGVALIVLACGGGGRESARGAT